MRVTDTADLRQPSRQRGALRFLREVFAADRPLAVWWAALVIAQAVLPVLFVVLMARTTGAVVGGTLGVGDVVALGAVFIFMHVIAPFATEAAQNLGDRTVDWLNQRVMAATTRPYGIRHLERHDHADLLVRARDFDLALTGPPISVAMGFVTSGLTTLLGGVLMCGLLAGFRWWAALVVASAWLATHWFLRDSAVWKGHADQEVGDARREAEYTYRTAVDPPAAKEIRLFGLGSWLADTFEEQRALLLRFRHAGTRIHWQRLAGAAGLVIAAHALLVLAVVHDAATGSLGLAEAMQVVLATMGAGGIAYSGLNGTLSSCGQVVASVDELEDVLARDDDVRTGTRVADDALPSSGIRFRDVHFAYDLAEEEVLRGLDLEIPAGASVALVGLNGAGKTTVAKLLARLYDPTQGVVEVDGIDLRELDLDSWRRRLTVIYQDFIRFEASLRDNVRLLGAPDEVIEDALRTAHADGLIDLDTVLGRGYTGGTELSGGQWQRVAIARAIAAVRTGAGVVVLDEPTAQVDAKSEMVLFERLLAATSGCTRILISHRFPTVRLADLIHVLEDGRVVESGSHDDLMALGGRYSTMYRAQSARFEERVDDDVIS